MPALCLLCGLIAGVELHDWWQGDLQQKLEKVRVALISQHKDNARLTTHNATLEARILLSHEELSQARAREKDLRSELHKVSETVAFYQNVMAPEGVSDGLIVDGLHVFAQKQDNLYRAEFVLLQRINRRAVIKGFLNICIVGLVDGQAHRVCAGSVRLLPDGPVKYRFKFFQAVSFDFELPANFIPEHIDFVSDVYQYTTKRQDFFWQAEWQTVVQAADDSAREHADGH